MSTGKHNANQDPAGAEVALVNNNGANGAPLQTLGTLSLPNVRSDETLSVPSDNDTFWLRPRPLDSHGSVCGWYEPPLAPPAKEEIEKLAAWLEQQGYPAQAISLRLSYHRTVTAKEELERLVKDSVQRLKHHNQRVQQENRQLDEKIAAAEKRLQKAQEELEEARQREVESFAKAGLPRDPTALDLSIFEQVPSLEESAGAGGFTYRPLTSPGFKLFDLLAPVIIGFMVAVCLGTLTGLVELRDLNRLSLYWPKFLIVGLLGSVMVYLFGTMASYLTQIAARYALEREPDQPPQKVKGWVAPAVLLVSVLVMGLVMAAEIAVEGIGIRELNTQRVAAWARVSGQAVEQSSLTVLPLWLVLLIGTVITVPYIFSKIAKAWEECETSQRENWARHRRRQGVEERLTDEKVVAAMQAAGKALRCQAVVERLRQEIAELQTQRPPLQEEFDPLTKSRIEAARLAASGEAALLHAHIRWIVDRLDPLPAKSWWHWLFDWLFGRRLRPTVGRRI
jgi:hypothetical protein